MGESFVFDLSIILGAAACLSVLAVVFRQPILVAYIAAGIVIGPWGAGIIKDMGFIKIVSHLGITLLLFLAGLNLHPQRLLRLFRESALVTFLNSFVSFLWGWVFPFLQALAWWRACILGWP